MPPKESLRDTLLQFNKIRRRILEEDVAEAGDLTPPTEDELINEDAELSVAEENLPGLTLERHQERTRVTPLARPVNIDLKPILSGPPGPPDRPEFSRAEAILDAMPHFVGKELTRLGLEGIQQLNVESPEDQTFMPTSGRPGEPETVGEFIEDAFNTPATLLGQLVSTPPELLKADQEGRFDNLLQNTLNAAMIRIADPSSGTIPEQIVADIPRLVLGLARGVVEFPKEAAIDIWNQITLQDPNGFIKATAIPQAMETIRFILEDPLSATRTPFSSAFGVVAPALIGGGVLRGGVRLRNNVRGHGAARVEGPTGRVSQPSVIEGAPVPDVSVAARAGREFTGLLRERAKELGLLDEQGVPRLSSEESMRILIEDMGDTNFHVTFTTDKLSDAGKTIRKVLEDLPEASQLRAEFISPERVAQATLSFIDRANLESPLVSLEGGVNIAARRSAEQAIVEIAGGKEGLFQEAGQVFQKSVEALTQRETRPGALEFSSTARLSIMEMADVVDVSMPEVTSIMKSAQKTLSIADMDPAGAAFIASRLRSLRKEARAGVGSMEAQALLSDVFIALFQENPAFTKAQFRSFVEQQFPTIPGQESRFTRGNLPIDAAVDSAFAIKHLPGVVDRARQRFKKSAEVESARKTAITRVGPISRISEHQALDALIETRNRPATSQELLLRTNRFAKVADSQEFITALDRLVEDGFVEKRTSGATNTYRLLEQEVIDIPVTSRIRAMSEGVPLNPVDLATLLRTAQPELLATFNRMAAATKMSPKARQVAFNAIKEARREAGDSAGVTLSDSEFSALSPDHGRWVRQMRTVQKAGGLNDPVIEIAKAILKDMNPEALRLDLQPSKNGFQYAGTAQYTKRLITMTNQPKSGFAWTLNTLLHEYFHIARDLFITNKDRAIIQEVFDKTTRDERLATTLGKDSRATGMAEHYAQNSNEFFAETGAWFVLEGASKFPQLSPMLNRLGRVFNKAWGELWGHTTEVIPELRNITDVYNKALQRSPEIIARQKEILKRREGPRSQAAAQAESLKVVNRMKRASDLGARTGLPPGSITDMGIISNSFRNNERVVDVVTFVDNQLALPPETASALQEMSKTFGLVPNGVKKLADAQFSALGDGFRVNFRVMADSPGRNGLKNNLLRPLEAATLPVEAISAVQARFKGISEATAEAMLQSPSPKQGAELGLREIGVLRRNLDAQESKFVEAAVDTGAEFLLEVRDKMRAGELSDLTFNKAEALDLRISEATTGSTPTMPTGRPMEVGSGKNLDAVSTIREFRDAELRTTEFEKPPNMPPDHPTPPPGSTSGASGYEVTRAPAVWDPWFNIGTPANQFARIARKFNLPKVAKAINDIIFADIDIRRRVGGLDRQVETILAQAPRGSFGTKSGRIMREKIGELLDGKTIKDIEALKGLSEIEKKVLTDFRTYLDNFRDRIVKLYEEAGLEVPKDWGIDGYFPHTFSGDFFLRDARSGTVIGSAKNRLQMNSLIHRMAKDGRIKDASEVSVTVNSLIDPDIIRLGDARYGRVITDLAKQLGMTKEEIANAMKGTIGRKAGRIKMSTFLMRRRGATGFETDVRSVLRGYNRSITRWEHLSRLRRNVQPMIDEIRKGGQEHLADHLDANLDMVWGQRSKMSRKVDSWFSNAIGYRMIWRPGMFDRVMARQRNATAFLLLKTPRFWVLNSMQPFQTLWPTVSSAQFARGVGLLFSKEGREIIKRHGVQYDVSRFLSNPASIGPMTRGLTELRRRIAENSVFSVVSSEVRNQQLSYLTWFDITRKQLQGLTDSQFATEKVPIGKPNMVDIGSGRVRHTQKVGRFTEIEWEGEPKIIQLADGGQRRVPDRKAPDWIVRVKKEALGDPRHGVEVVGRGMTQKDAIRLAHREERPLATDFLSNRTAVLKGQVYTQFLKSVADDLGFVGKSQALRSAVLFRRFQIKNLELGLSMLGRRTKGGSPLGFSKWLLAQGLVGGTRQFIKWATIFKVLTSATNDAKIGDIPLSLHTAISETVGEKAADMFLWGVPALIGLDYSYSVQLADVPYSDTVPEMIGELILGAQGQLIVRAAETALDTRGPEPRGFLERFARGAARQTPVGREIHGVKEVSRLMIEARRDDPSLSAIETWMKIANNQYEIDDPAGRVRLRTDLKTALLHFAGFRSTDFSKQELMIRSIMEIMEARDRVMTQASQQLVAGDTKEMMRLLVDWNESWQEFFIRPIDLRDRTISRIQGARQDTLDRLILNAPSVFRTFRPNVRNEIIQWLMMVREQAPPPANEEPEFIMDGVAPEARDKEAREQ